MLRALSDYLFVPKEKFSIERLQFRFAQLQKNEIITEGNRAQVVEVLREISEILIWGDQHNNRFFEFFCEKRMLSYFLKILSQKTSKHVKVQLIQTLSMLINNISDEMSVFYLLSQNHINDLITHPFDFGDEDLLAHYITFLKTLSLKLNSKTVQFFFNERKEAGPDFPLYTEAIRFFSNEESMIRIAVRTITLNVYNVDFPPARRFILESSAVPYFTNLASFIREQFWNLDLLLKRFRLDAARAAGIAAAAAAAAASVAAASSANHTLPVIMGTPSSSVTMLPAPSSRNNSIIYPQPPGAGGSDHSHSKPAAASHTRQPSAEFNSPAAQSASTPHSHSAHLPPAPMSPSSIPPSNSLPTPSSASAASTSKENSENSGDVTFRKLQDYVAEQLDHLYYLNDILSLNIPEMCRLLNDRMFRIVFHPFVLRCIAPGTRKGKHQISSHVSLFLLSQAFHIFSHPNLVHVLGTVAFDPCPPLIELPQHSASSAPPSLSGTPMAASRHQRQPSESDIHQSIPSSSSSASLPFSSSSSGEDSSLPQPSASAPAPAPISPEDDWLASSSIISPSSSSSSIPPKEEAPAVAAAPAAGSRKSSLKSSESSQSDVIGRFATLWASPSSSCEALERLESNPIRDTILESLSSSDERMLANAVSCILTFVSNVSSRASLLEKADMLPQKLFVNKRLLDELTSPDEQREVDIISSSVPSSSFAPSSISASASRPQHRRHHSHDESAEANGAIAPLSGLRNRGSLFDSSSSASPGPSSSHQPSNSSSILVAAPSSPLIHTSSSLSAHSRTGSGSSVSSVNNNNHGNSLFADDNSSDDDDDDGPFLSAASHISSSSSNGSIVSNASKTPQMNQTSVLAPSLVSAPHPVHHESPSPSDPLQSSSLSSDVDDEGEESSEEVEGQEDVDVPIQVSAEGVEQQQQSPAESPADSRIECEAPIEVLEESQEEVRIPAVEGEEAEKEEEKEQSVVEDHEMEEAESVVADVPTEPSVPVVEPIVPPPLSAPSISLSFPLPAHVPSPKRTRSQLEMQYDESVASALLIQVNEEAESRSRHNDASYSTPLSAERSRSAQVQYPFQMIGQLLSLLHVTPLLNPSLLSPSPLASSYISSPPPSGVSLLPSSSSSSSSSSSASASQPPSPQPQQQNSIRIITTHLICRLLLQFISCHPGKSPLSSPHSKQLSDLFDESLKRVRQRSETDFGHLVLLLLLDDEFREFKRLVVSKTEVLITNPCLLLLPAECASTAALAAEFSLYERWPRNELERIRCDLQAFFIRRYLKHMMTGARSDPLSCPFVGMKPPQPNSEIDMKARDSIPSQLYINDFLFRPRLFLIEPKREHLLLIETHPTVLHRGTVREIMPLLVLKLDPNTHLARPSFRVFCSPEARASGATKHFDHILIFETQAQKAAALEALEARIAQLQTTKSEDFKTWCETL